ncbi:MAG: hypothetical protein ACREC3_03760, partial [Methyloceanibacter sp.]
VIARRFRDLLTGADNEETQLDQLRRRYAALCLAAEQIEAKAARGEAYDVALLCNVTGQISRVQDRIAELLKPAPEPEPEKPVYCEPKFHEMSDAAFDQWIAERGITSKWCASEKRAREHLRDLAAREADRPRIWAELVASGEHRIMPNQSEVHTSSNENEESKDDEALDPYADCGVTL